MTPIQQAITSLSLLQAISEGVQGMNMTDPKILQAEATGQNWLRDYCNKIHSMADKRDEPTEEDIRSDRVTEDRYERMNNE